MKRNVARAISLTISLVMPLACTTKGTANDASADGGGVGSPTTSPEAGVSSPDSGTVTATSHGLSCLGVLQCATKCPDEGVDACVQKCVDQTQPSSQPVTNALVKCITDSKCEDAECLKGRCDSEIGACAADDATIVQGEPSKGPTPQGSTPAALVGTWSQGQTLFQFDADGKTSQVFSSTTTIGGYCTSGIGVTSSGVTTVTGDILVYHRVEGTQVTTSCGSSSSKALDPADITYRYELGTFDDGTPKLSLFRRVEGSPESDALELHH